MQTFHLVAENIKQYLIEEEIIKFISKDHRLDEVYNHIKDQNTSCVVPLVSLEDNIKHSYDLNIIVWHDQRSTYGQLEYFWVFDFVNTKTNLYKLIESLSISPGIELLPFLENIHSQLTELGVQINQEYILKTDHQDKNIYFEKSFRITGLS
jgi:hypothetical protein